MMQYVQHGRSASVQFTGTRSQLLGTLVHGYLMMVPTLGIYRFWLVTWKRRFYWSHTELDGDPLEYTGSAIQLLIGFLFAIGIFLPIYIVLLYLSTQDQTITLIGYSVMGVVLWLLIGYALYKARDFRLSRTLWRGIRFDQAGSAWSYAFRRFGWSILMVITAGLIYPFMAGNLWRYRYENTWYGDRKFSFSGSWRTVAGPFYGVYALIVLPLVAIGAYAYTHDVFRTDPELVPTQVGLSIATLAVALIAGLCWFYYQGQEVSRMLSTVRLGNAMMQVRVRGRTLLGQFLVYNLLLSAAFTAVGTVGAIIAGILVALGWIDKDGQFVPDLAILIQNAGLLSALAVIGGYLLFAATFSLVGEIVLGYGYWTAVARGMVVHNLDDLRSVRARGEDRALAGEGLADALNVGAY
jgi:uncharacterized membrane protein YjgN (DUF898 family)